MFVDAGWRTSHEAADTRDEPLAQPLNAFQVFAQFAGLHVGKVGAGRDLAASNVSFFIAPRPEANVVAEPWCKTVGELQAIATAHNDHMLVLVSSAGQVYAYTDPDDQLYLLGSNFSEAMERLLLGGSYGSALPRDA